MVVFTEKELKELKENLPEAQIIIEELLKSELVEIIDYVDLVEINLCED